MPIVTENTQTNSLNDDSIFCNEDGDESFVVLERIMANDGVSNTDMEFSHEPTSSFPFLENCSFPVFNEPPSNDMSSSRISHHSQVGQSQNYEHSNVSESAEGVQKMLQNVLYENINLKDTINQNNLTMRQQLCTVKLLQERNCEVLKKHEVKFEETKAEIIKLRKDNEELKTERSALGSEVTKLVSENATLKTQVATLQTASENIEKTASQELLSENATLKNQISALQTASENNEKTASQELLSENATLKGQISALQTALENNDKTAAQQLEAGRSESLKTIGVLSDEVNKLRADNAELKTERSALGSEATKLLSENAALKTQISALQTVSENNEKKSSHQQNSKEQELNQLVEQLTQKLEAVERARRQQEFDIDRLQAQVGRTNDELNETQRKLALSENALQAAQQTPTQHSLLPFNEKMMRYDSLLKEFKKSIEEEDTRATSLTSWLNVADPANSAQFEISELRRLLVQEQSQSVNRKENLNRAAAVMYELMNDFKKLSEELACVKADHAVKESHGFAYDEMQKKGFIERIDSLTAKLVEREENLAISERHLASLQEAVRLQNEEKKDSSEVKDLKEQVEALTKDLASVNLQTAVKTEQLQEKIRLLNALRDEVKTLRATKETVTVLEEQAKIFQADFNAERQAREALVAEKERLLEDFRHLQKRNEELIKEVTDLRSEISGASVPSAPVEQNPRREERQLTLGSTTKTPKFRISQFVCPNTDCNLSFGSLNEVNDHVIACWGLPD